MNNDNYRYFAFIIDSFGIPITREVKFDEYTSNSNDNIRQFNLNMTGLVCLQLRIVAKEIRER